MNTPNKIAYQRKVWKKTELFIPALVILGIALLVFFARESVFPIIISITLAYLLNPVIDFFENRGIKRVYAVAGLYLIAAVVLGVVIKLLFPLVNSQVSEIADKWPIYMGKFEGMIIEMQDKAYKSVPILRQFGDWKTLAAKAVGMMGSAPAFIIGLVPKLAMLILVPFISFFFMLEGRAMIDMLINLIPSKYVEIVQHVICEVDESLGNYLRGILIEATILFVMALLGLVSLEINYAVPIAVIVGLSSLVPYIGPLVGGLISAIAAFLQYNSLAMVLNVVIFFVSLRFIDDWVLQPMILKHAMQVHPVVIIFAIMAGAELFGIWGIIFAMPVTCIIKVVISVALELQRTEFAWKPKPEPTRISIPYT